MRPAEMLASEAFAEVSSAARLLDAARDLAEARSIEEVTRAVRLAARDLVRADGVTFVLREGDLVHYVDEEAIAPLWKGSRFPAQACISGWAMLHRQPAIVPDIYADPRIPEQLYRPTFVRSLVMIPVRPEDPVASIGAYWARVRHPTDAEVQLLESLAGFAAVALANVRLVAELREAVSAREGFLSVASHELRTPLTPLRLQLDAARTALASGAPAEAVAAHLAKADRSSRRVEQLVDELLDATRVFEQQLAIVRAPADVASIARLVVERRDAERTPVRLETTPGEDTTAAVDASRIEQAVENLVANAVKFGRGAPVRVCVSAGEGHVRVSVHDRGIGVRPEDLGRIFDRFARAVSDRQYGGLGLGLWLVRRIVEAHGGRVSAESRPGEETTFTLVLPR